MIHVRKADQRGHAQHGWLNEYHTFSFAEYADPDFMGFRSLRVINEDRIAAGTGFGTHGHRDMEIITYVLGGALKHSDSLGNGGVLHRDRIQRMRAGSGIRHSEFNGSDKDELHLFQIWLLPDKNGLPPAYEDRTFDPADAEGKWQLLVSPNGREGSLDIATDANLRRVFLKPDEEVTLELPPGRHAWVQLAQGQVLLNETSELSSSDAASLSGEKQLKLKAVAATEALVFDLA